MKKIVLLSWMLVTLMAIAAYPQRNKAFNHHDPAAVHRNGITPPGSAGILPLSPKNFPAGWRLDSTWYSSWDTTSSSWDLYERQFYNYSPNGFILEVLYLNLNEGTQDWDNWTRYVYEYYSSGNILRIIEQAWDIGDGIWKDINYSHFNVQGRVDTTFYKNYSRSLNRYLNGNQSIYTFNANNQYLETLSQTLDSATSNWVNQYRTLYTYANGNILSEMASQYWDVVLSDWVNSMKYDYSYDGSGFPIGFMEYTWNATSVSWDNYEKGTITNNASGNPIQELDEQWDFGTSSWVNHQMETYQYNPNGKETQYIVQDWDPVLLAWKNYSKETYSYYPNGNTEEYYQYAWNPLTLAYMDIIYSLNDTSGYNLEYYDKYLDWSSYQYTYGYKYDYSYNSNHNPLGSLEQLLNLNTLTWYDASRRTDTYDANGYCILELDQSFDTISAAWTNIYKQDHFYNFTNSIRVIPGLKDYCYFSNPLQAGASIVCPDLEKGKTYEVNLLNMQGQLVYSTYLRSGDSFSVPQDLADGMYMMQIIEDTKMVASGKVIVKK